MSVSGPLWRVLESDNVTILEMNMYFDVLIIKLDAWAQDASRLSQGDAELYADYPPTKDEIWYCLIASTDHDATTQELLEVLCNVFSALVSKTPYLVEHTVILVLSSPMKLSQFPKQTL